MEFNARYALTGLFAIAVALGMFAFVYWLENSGGFGERAEYRIRFTVPVSGLANGGDVLFNGIRVGEVKDVRFDQERPDSIVATISIASYTPVREDTVVGVDYQGLTGAANVLLTGGSASAPALARTQGAVPEIEADPTASRSWTQNAARVLGRLDGMLERNGDRFDGIMAGLEKLAGGGQDKKGAFIHDLAAPRDFPPDLPPATWQLAIAEPSVLLSLNTDSLLEQPQPDSLRPMGAGKWADSLPNLFQTKLAQGFENAGYTDSVLRAAEADDPDYRLAIDVREFNLATFDGPQARIDLTARLLNRDGATVASKRFSGNGQAAGAGEAEAVEAMSALFARIATEVVVWTVNSISAAQ